MTTDQASLFGEPTARRTDPDTSHAAAASITPGRCEDAIIDVFVRLDAELTDDEIARWLPHLYPPTVKSARSRLTKCGTLIDTGRRAASDRGRAMIIWRLA